MTATRTLPITEPRPVEATPAMPRFPWSALIVLVGALLFGALLNADALVKTARSREPGWQRDATVAVASGLAQVSDLLHLDLPRRSLDEVLGHGSPAVAPTVAPPAPTTPTIVITTTAGAASTTTKEPEVDTTRAAPTTETLPGVFLPSAESPARLWVTGDSLTESFGPALVNQAAVTGVIEPRHEVRYSTGLTRPDFFDWPSYLAGELDEDPQEIFVFMIGANDGQPIETEAGWIPFGADDWRAEYRRRVAATMALLEGRVPTVYWIGQPIARSADYAEKMAVMNEIYRTEAARHPGIRYVDTWEPFSDDAGGYTAYLPDSSGDEVLMRRSDGIHLTPAGGEYLADIVLEVIGEDWPLPSASD